MTTYSSFADFYDRFVRPLGDEHPRWIRLDGQTAGGNREVAGVFWHAGRRWKVHVDTHFGPLRVARAAIQGGIDPFVETRTPARNANLVLTDALHAQTGERHRYLYIYEVPGPGQT